MGPTAIHRDIEEHDDSHVLREDASPYMPVLDSETSRLRAGNMVFFDDSV